MSAQINGTPAAPLTAPFPKRKVILNVCGLSSNTGHRYRALTFLNELQAFDCITPSHQVGGTWVGEKEGHQFDSVHYWLDTGQFHTK